MLTPLLSPDPCGCSLSESRKGEGEVEGVRVQQCSSAAVQQCKSTTHLPRCERCDSEGEDEGSKRGKEGQADLAQVLPNTSVIFLFSS